jgi:spore germination cell wall hydrolase CwlJ-like protein
MLATFCLAALIYAEARGEPLDGRLLVAETVYNRMDHGAYPDSVCAVVTEANQYSLPQSVDEYEAWRTSWLIAAAERVIEGDEHAGTSENDSRMADLVMAVAAARKTR